MLLRWSRSQQARRGQGKSCTRASEGGLGSSAISLFCLILKPYLLRGSAPTPRYPLLALLSICIASVRKCRRTFHGSDRQREAECDSKSRGLVQQIHGKRTWMHFGDISAVWVGLGFLFYIHICAEKSGDLGAHRLARAARCQQIGLRTQLLTVWTQLDPKSHRPTHTTRYPAVFDWERWVCMHSSLGRRGGGVWAGLRRLSFPLHA